VGYLVDDRVTEAAPIVGLSTRGKRVCRAIAGGAVFAAIGVAVLEVLSCTFFMVRDPLGCVWHQAASLSSLSSPRITILSASSDSGRCSAFEAQ
jgi:hypothetical protein